jgi:hypothetical protein
MAGELPRLARLRAGPRAVRRGEGEDNADTRTIVDLASDEDRARRLRHRVV